MGKWYGSINNRLEENRQFCDTIEVGTLATEYYWSDREPYEVVDVKDQKHVTIRGMGHVHVGDGEMDNNWELVSLPENPTIDLVKRGKYWYRAVTATIEDIFAMEAMVPDEKIEMQLWFIHNGFDLDRIKEKGQQTRYHRMNISFGVGEYYYDYSF